MSDQLLKHVAQYVDLDENEVSCFLSLLRSRKLRKRQFLLHEGEVCRFSGFITKGCLRTYEIDHSGNEHVLAFAIEEWWVGDLYSLFTDSPTLYNIDALEDTEILLLEKNDQETLYRKVPKFERYFRILVQNAFIATQRRIMTTLTKPAEERYLVFLEKFPTLEQRIPQRQIASYLGITAESLSRIRRQLIGRR